MGKLCNIIKKPPEPLPMRENPQNYSIITSQEILQHPSTTPAALPTATPIYQLYL